MTKAKKAKPAKEPKKEPKPKEPKKEPKVRVYKSRIIEPQDGVIGQKIRIRRIEMGISQAELGKPLGVSFQQIQKYEKGVNRVSAGRLHHIAKLLDVTTDYFYDNLTRNENEVQSLLFTDPKFSLRLLRAYAKLPQPQQRHLITLMESMAGEDLTAEQGSEA